MRKLKFILANGKEIIHEIENDQHAKRWILRPICDTSDCEGCQFINKGASCIIIKGFNSQDIKEVIDITDAVELPIKPTSLLSEPECLLCGKKLQDPSLLCDCQIVTFFSPDKKESVETHTTRDKIRLITIREIGLGNYEKAIHYIQLLGETK